MDGNLAPKGNSKVIWIVIAVLVVVGIVGYFIWKKKKETTTNTASGSRSYGETSANQATESTTVTKVVTDKIQIGSKGDKVKLLQTYLNNKHNAGLQVDGIFGNGTKKAVDSAGLPYPVKDSDLAAATNKPIDAIKKATVDAVGKINKANGFILDTLSAGLFSKVKGLFS
jgi:LPXTG-motif cell wall-anchored protein